MLAMFCLKNRLVDIEITFALKGINLQTVRSHELPDCYQFFVKVRSIFGDKNPVTSILACITESIHFDFFADSL